MADVIDIANDIQQRRLDAALAHHAIAATAPGSAECDDCGIEIPQARRLASPGVATCIDCQTIREHKARGVRR